MWFIIKPINMQRKKYQVFTPESVVEKMLDFLGYNGELIINKKIIDISCGDGAFLVSAAERLIAECKNKNLATKEIMEKCSQNICGIEIETEYYKKCIKRLNEVIKKHFKKLCIKWKNVNNGDGLLHSEGNYDFVVGNPPYISYKDISSEQKEYLRNNFLSCKQYRFDYSFAFIEKSLNILSDQGKGCIISPINMYRIKSGIGIKELIRPYLDIIVDVTEDNIFPRVLTNPVISVFSKTKKTNEIILLKRDLAPRKLPRETFENDINLFINVGSRRFGDYFSVHNGVATLYNEAFIVNSDSDLESEVLMNARSPKFSRFNLDKKIIFPYLFSNGTINKIDEKEFFKKYPKAYLHLLNYKTELLNRKSSPNTSWFEYGRSQAIADMQKPKIMIPAIMSKNVMPVMLDKNDVVFAGFYVVEKDPTNHPLSEAFEILSNTKELYGYIKHSGVKMNGGSFRYSPKALEDFKF